MSQSRSCSLCGAEHETGGDAACCQQRHHEQNHAGAMEVCPERFCRTAAWILAQQIVEAE